MRGALAERGKGYTDACRRCAGNHPARADGHATIPEQRALLENANNKSLVEGALMATASWETNNRKANASDLILSVPLRAACARYASRTQPRQHGKGRHRLQTR